MKCAFIGLGNMASAIIGGMIKSGKFDKGDISGCDISEERRNYCKDELVITVYKSVSEIKKSDVTVIAVKPQVIESVMGEIGSEHGLVISIAAGKTLDYLENHLGNRPIARVMPNINAMVLAATSAYAVNTCATDEHKKQVEAIFSTVGEIIELPEKQFSIFTAIGGSSPAFAYIYINALADAGVKGGLSRAAALKIAASTVYGSAKMIMESGVHPIELCDRVCSPAGTTIEGVLSLKESGFESSVHKAIDEVVRKNERM